MEVALRRAREADLPRMLEILKEAKAFLRANGVDQWQAGYPNEAALREDIAAGRGYALECGGNVGGFLALCFGEEADYRGIFDGAWQGKEPYACIHRLAVSSALRGTGAARCAVLQAEKIARGCGALTMRVDTHEKNLPMQRMLERCGYVRRGKIIIGAGLEAGTERIALEKVLTSCLEK